MAWESRPVFVSSTFADMQAERDHLRTHVFPALEERLRSRRHHLEWVDLRLGVAVASLQDAEMRELQVLKVCLGEVQRCRPFLIVLLGDRYGWVPPPERIAAAAREVGFDENMTGRSVTDLEIQFGILGDKERQPRCFFYFRQPLPYADMPRKVAAVYADAYDVDPSAALRSKQLTALKGEIEAALPERVRRYTAGWDGRRQCVTSIDAWGQTVLEDLWSEILATTAASKAEAEISWQQAERNALDDYIEDRSRDFVGRAAMLSRLGQLASSATQQLAAWGVSLTAPPGSGKSAIFAELHRRLKQQGVFVLAHAAAASARAPSVDDMLRRWIEELGAASGADPVLADNADSDTIEATFRSHLNRMAEKRRVIVLIDGLDQFEATTRARFATWLPRLWPDNARLIATAVASDASKALEARAGVETFGVPPLDTVEARRIVEAICARYHRTLEPEVLQALLAKRGEAGPAWSNTLWLVLAVEELNLVDVDAFGRAMQTYTGSIAEQLRALMLDVVANLPSDVLGIYTASFERAEKLFGSALAQAFLGFIAISRAGWRESDFRVLLPRATGKEWDELHFASLRRLFRGQIRQRGAMGQWDVNHAQMRAAIRQYLRGRSITETKRHAFAAQHLLLSLPADDPLRQSETMVHLLGSRDWPLAAEFYGGASLSQPELEGATRVLADAILTSRQAGEMTGLDQVLNMLGGVGQISDNRTELIAGNIATRLLEYLEPILARRGELRSRAILLEAIRKTFGQLAKVNPRKAVWPTGLCAALSKIGDVLAAQGNLTAALATYRQTRDIAENLANAGLGDAVWEHDLCTSQDKIGDILVAQGNLAEALATYGHSRSIRERLTQSDPGNADWERGLSISLGKIGDILWDQGNLPAALASYRQGRDILERLAEANPDNAGSLRDLSVALLKIGDVLRDQGNLTEALASYRQDLEIAERLARADPGNVESQRDLSVSLLRIANVFYDERNLAEALAGYRQSRDIFERVAKTDPANAGWQRDLSIAQERIGDALAAQGDITGALVNFRQSQGIQERLAETDPANAEWERDRSILLGKIGDALVDQGNLADALVSYRRGREIIERLIKADPNNVAWRNILAALVNNIGNVLHAQGNFPEALASYRQSLDIFARLTAADPSNAIWRHNRSVAQERIAEVLRDQGNQPEARANSAQSRDKAEHFIKADPGNAGLHTEQTRGDRVVEDERADPLHVVGLMQINSGDDLRDAGNLSAALNRYQSARAVLHRLVETNPGANNTRFILGLSYLRIGDVLRVQGNIPGALDSYKLARAIFQSLVHIDPINTLWRSHLADAEEFVGILRMMQGHFSDAADNLKASIVTRDKLVTADPDNLVQRSYMANTIRNLGAIQWKLGQFDQAFRRYDKALSFRLRLVGDEPGNSKWQRDLIALHSDFGDLHHARGNTAAALDSYKAGLTAAKRLAETDPGNAEWQRDLTVLATKIRDLLSAQGDPASSDLQATRATDKAPPRNQQGTEAGGVRD